MERWEGATASCVRGRAPDLVSPLSRAVVCHAQAEAAAVKYKLEFSGDAMDVINHPDVEAVWICSPSQAPPR